MDKLVTNHGEIKFPAFMPDATYGSIKTVSFADAKNAGIEQIVTTTLHIEQKIGSQFIKKFGGIHKFFGWDRPILTDSGGWQVFSLINSKRGNSQNSATEVGCSFIDPNTGKSSLLTPESSMVIQHNLGSDIMTVLDFPIIGNSSLKERKECVRINTKWAERAKKKYDELHGSSSDGGKKTARMHNMHSRPKGEGNLRPLLGAVIQGGDDFKLRKQSAKELIDLDFDLYNFGGVPLNSGLTWRDDEDKGKFYKEMLQFVSDLIPKDKIKYAMGVGQPDDIAFCVETGWHLFDTVLPTRNARHGYLYVSEEQGDVQKGYKNLKYDVLHLRSERYKFDDKPVDENCDCECCKTVSRSYLRHLIRINESSGLRLATIHNLKFYSDWMNKFK